MLNIAIRAARKAGNVIAKNMSAVMTSKQVKKVLMIM